MKYILSMIITSFESVLYLININQYGITHVKSNEQCLTVARVWWLCIPSASLLTEHNECCRTTRESVSFQTCIYEASSRPIIGLLNCGVHH